MTFWVWHKDAELLSNIMVSFVLVFAVDTESDHFFIIIAFHEYVFSIVLFLIDPTLHVTNYIIMKIVFGFGILVIIVFKFTKASSLIPLPQTCCQQNSVVPFIT